MTNQDGLTGLTILVLEDDYLLAEDTRRTLEAAGATVLGPCRSASQARTLTSKKMPDCAIVDINLGEGPNFEPARDFLAQGVPILMTTGYDGSVIPEELREHPCLQKPVPADKILSAVSRLCSRS